MSDPHNHRCAACASACTHDSWLCTLFFFTVRRESAIRNQIEQRSANRESRIKQLWYLTNREFLELHAHHDDAYECVCGRRWRTMCRPLQLTSRHSPYPSTGR